MAIEIIPKKTIRFPFWLNILFYLSLVLLVASLISFFVLNYSLEKSSQAFKDLEETLVGERTSERITLEKQLISQEKRINDFSKLIEQHFLPSKFFSFLERVSYPRIYFSDLILNTQQASVILSGSTDSFSSLGQQVLILEREELIKDISLSKVSISKEGKVILNLDLSLDPRLFKP